MAFNLITDCYDLLANPEGRLAQEGPLYRQLITPGDQVLDLACGTGPQALFMAQECGAVVDASDLSPDMIAYARTNRPHPTITYAVRDMTQAIQKSYNLIICVGNSLNLLPSRELAQQTITNSIASLHSGGHLLLHLINPQAPANREVKKLTKTAQLPGGEVRIEKSLTPHATGRHLEIIYTPADGEPVTENAELLDLTRDELDVMLRATGETDVSWYGSLDRKPWEPGAPDILALLHKQ